VLSSVGFEIPCPTFVIEDSVRDGIKESDEFEFVDPGVGSRDTTEFEDKAGEGTTGKLD